MTPAEHIAEAEQALDEARAHNDQGTDWMATYELLRGTVHALIAIAVESGVPHSTGAPPEAVNG